MWQETLLQNFVKLEVNLKMTLPWKPRHQSNGMGWYVRYCFAMAILVIILPLIFVRSISRRSLDQTLWNLFFSILAISMATVAILKKSTIYSTTSHGMWYSYKVS
jgi:hypothetical protein